MKRETIRQFVKFGIIGIVNTLINLGCLYIFTEFFKIYYILSAVLAFLVAVTNSFVLNKIWTFKEKIYEDTSKKYVKFMIISVTALLVNLAILYFFTEFLHLHYLISQIIATGTNLIINFLGSKLWTFKK